jgi:hypothetical protein
MSRSGSIYGRLERLEGRFPRSNSEAESREEDFRRSVAILDELACYSPLKERDDLDRLVEESVPRALSAYGLSEEEVDEEASAYVEAFKSMLRDPGEGGGASYEHL